MALNIADLEFFRGAYSSVLQNTERCQTGVMTIAPGKSVGPREIHKRTDQIILVLDGSGAIEINGEREDINPMQCVLVPANSQHSVFNTSNVPLFFFTVNVPMA